MSQILAEHAARRPSPRLTIVCPDAGVDASYLACAVAHRLARRAERGPEESAQSRDAPVVLMDGQPGAGGLDVIADLETAPGARWPALRGAGLEIDADKLLAALPRRDGVAVLSHARLGVVLDDGVIIATSCALAGVARAVVATCTPQSLPTPLTADGLVLVVRASVASMAAAEAIMPALDPDLPCGLVVLEADSAARLAIADALAVPVVAQGPRRWSMGSTCASDTLAGRWPGQGDRAMSSLLDGIEEFTATLEGSLTWA